MKEKTGGGTELVVYEQRGGQWTEPYREEKMQICTLKATNILKGREKHKWREQTDTKWCMKWKKQSGRNTTYGDHQGQHMK